MSQLNLGSQKGIDIYFIFHSPTVSGMFEYYIHCVSMYVCKSDVNK